MDWVEKAPPSELQWAFGLISIIALVVALMVLPQMIWGRPKVKIRPSHISRDAERFIIFEVVSAQITNSILQAIGVYRRPTAAVANLTIIDTSTNDLLATWPPEIKSGVGVASHRVVMEPSALPYQVVVASAKNDGKAELIQRSGGTALNPGTYRAHFKLFADKYYVASETFVVGTEPYELHWELKGTN